MSNEVEQWEQFHNVTSGETNFCIIEERKAPVLFEILQELIYISMDDPKIQVGFGAPLQVHSWYNEKDYTFEIIVGKTGFYRAYRDLLENRYQYTRYGFQIAMGSLLGYDIESCIEYAAQDPHACECSKCGGPKLDTDDHIRAQWVKLGCNHILRDMDQERFVDEDGHTYRQLPNGRLYDVIPEAVEGNLDLQPWSRPS